MNLIKIAWRNLWRNKRRTAITGASILFAVFFAILMRAYQLGFYDHMIKSAIGSYAGFLQIQHPAFEHDPSLENSFECSSEFLKTLDSFQGIKAVVPRIETFALASSGEHTKGALVLGIDPEREMSLSDPAGKLVRFRIQSAGIEKLKQEKLVEDDLIKIASHSLQYSFASQEAMAHYFELDSKTDKEVVQKLEQAFSFGGKEMQASENGVLISDRLSKFLRIGPGDTLVLLGQAYRGSSAAGLYPVYGIVKIANPELDNKLVYMPLQAASTFSDLTNRVTSIAINLHDNSDKNMFALQQQLSNQLSQDILKIKNWKELNPVLVQQIESDNQSGKLFLGLLYLIIFFGIFGTVLMMIHERHREMGVLIAIGMRRTRLVLVLMIEMCIMGAMGVLSGLLLSTPFIWIGNKNPMRFYGEMAQIMEEMGFEAVMPLAWFDTYLLWQGLVVALMVVLASIYPLSKIFYIKEAEALKA
ncbi:MAG: ABC transporter permease [Bacteroidota bacterium]|nr:MAG: ABC transporter permease [Bacteroidota bacterium]